MNDASVPTEQVSNRKTRNNINRNNQIVAFVSAEQVTTEKFHYKELTPYQVVVLHQKR
jgi:effector-binding domain-containing protein